MSEGKIPMFFLGVILMLVPGSTLAQDCDCWQVTTDDVPTPCAGPGGCNSEYYREFCDFGCYQGTCETSGYGMCCDTPTETKSINLQQCDPPRHCGECGQTRVHRFAGALSDGARVGAALAKRERRVSFQGLSSGATLFVPDRCRRTYGVIWEGMAPGGAPRASSGVLAVRTNGGN
jgi:hypothetical protein